MDKPTILVLFGILFATTYYMNSPNTYQFKGAMLILFVVSFIVLCHGFYKNYKEKGRLIL